MSDDAVEKVVPETGGGGTGEETLEPLHVLDEEEREGGSGKREREEESGANGEAKKLKTDG